MKALRWTIPLLVALLAGCFPKTEPMLAPPCPLASVEVAADAPPIFKWPSTCGVSVLQVSLSNDRTALRWSIATPDFLPDILAPVTYGEVPAGLNQGTAPVPLVAGTEYRMNLLVVVDNVASTISSVRFTQP
jgi:hypothetical protein